MPEMGSFKAGCWVVGFKVLDGLWRWQTKKSR
jgi:hypothetical protein